MRKRYVKFEKNTLEETEIILNLWIEDTVKKKTPLSSFILKGKTENKFDHFKSQCDASKSLFDFQVGKRWFKHF